VIADPGRRARAPEPLRRVQLFVNTLDIENVVDLLETPEGLDAALREIDGLPLPEEPSTPADLARALELREAFRLLLLANNGVPVDHHALRAVERAARTAHLELAFGDDGRARLVAAAPGIDGTLGDLVAVAFTAMADGSWARLKACRREICHWAFYDRSRNRSSHWCSMLVCGNRTKAARYRRTHAGAVV
jgi:predicted RNA-binding Zn ribbon-like protein